MGPTSQKRTKTGLKFISPNSCADMGKIKNMHYTICLNAISSICRPELSAFGNSQMGKLVQAKIANQAVGVVWEREKKLGVQLHEGA